MKKTWVAGVHAHLQKKQVHSYIDTTYKPNGDHLMYRWKTHGSRQTAFCIRRSDARGERVARSPVRWGRIACTILA